MFTYDVIYYALLTHARAHTQTDTHTDTHKAYKAHKAQSAKTSTAFVSPLPNTFRCVHSMESLHAAGAPTQLPPVSLFHHSLHK
jgi:hypothetical protein